MTRLRLPLLIYWNYLFPEIGTISSDFGARDQTSIKIWGKNERNKSLNMKKRMARASKISHSSVNHFQHRKIPMLASYHTSDAGNPFCLNNHYA